MPESHDNILALRAIGVITRADYAQLTPICEDLIRREGEIRMLIDMQEFELEEPIAWGADFHFGREFHNKIERMAIVGDKRWEQWMMDFCRPFYAREAQFFHRVDIDVAWNWLEERRAVAA